MRRWTTVLAALFLVALPAVAHAQNYSPQAGPLAVSDPTPAPGQTITVSSPSTHRYASNATVTITMESQPVTLKTTTADAAGVLNTQVTIPSNTTPGTHTLRAVGREADGGTLTLAAAIVVGAGGTQGGGALPRTGPTSAIGLTGIGFLLASAGGVVAAVQSRRKAGVENLFGGNLFRW